MAGEMVDEQTSIVLRVTLGQCIEELQFEEALPLVQDEMLDSIIV